MQAKNPGAVSGKVDDQVIAFDIEFDTRSRSFEGRKDCQEIAMVRASYLG
jgi:hypothetical protein